MVDKSKIVEGVVTIGLIVWFLYQVYHSGVKLLRKDTGTLESLTVETEIQYPSIAVCPRPHEKLPYNGTKFPTPEDYNDTALLDLKSCNQNEDVKDRQRNRIIFSNYGSFKICVLYEPTSKCHPGNRHKISFTMNASYVYGFDYFTYNKDEMFLPIYNGLYGIEGQKVILKDYERSLGYYKYFKLTRQMMS